MSRAPRRTLSIATNNADVGGGEVMLLAIADAARELGCPPEVVAPDGSEIARAAQAAGHDVVLLRADGRPEWMRALRRWDRRHRRGVLWCNGLVPAAATAGRRGRVVHLHRIPDGGQRLLLPVARAGASMTVVPSRFMASRVRGARVLHNWSEPRAVTRAADPTLPRVGFLGRLSPDKGILQLAEAMHAVPDAELVIAGEARFVAAGDSASVEAALAGLGTRARRRGWVDPAEFLGQVDVLAVPSTWPEPFGLVVTEAMAAGLPVVVSDAGALPEVVGSAHPWVARAGDVGHLAMTIRTALDASADERDRVVAAARRRWEDHFSPQAGKHRIASVLGELGLIESEGPAR